MPDAPGILFTAFEPSGDVLAAAVISELRRARPQVPLFALGGPRMEAAGATILESTTGRPVMFARALLQAREHGRRVQRLRKWLDQHRIAALVPTDSPAANWSICAAVRRSQPGAAIVHLAAPQLWAWAPWRVRKLRRLTDHVLCLLPFEPAWFSQRGVPATFVGHPVFDSNRAPPDAGDLPPGGGPKLALLPGSRPSEVRRNWPTMLAVYRKLAREHPELQAVVAAAHPGAHDLVCQISRRSGGGGRWAGGLQVRTGQTEAVVQWADVVLVVSGTATLQVASCLTPMVVMFNAGWWAWHLLGRWVIETRTFALPNLILARGPGAGGEECEAHGSDHRERVVPEFVPHFGAVEPIRAEVDRLIRDPGAREAQVRGLGDLGILFGAHEFAGEATGRILSMIEPPGNATPTHEGPPVCC